jgi:hypothetical protein
MVAPEMRCTDALHTELEAFLQRAAQLPRGGWWSDFLRKADTTKIEALLREEPTLGEFHREDLRENGSGSSRITVESLLSWLASRGLAAGAEQAAQELARYAVSPTFPIRFLAGVRGVTVEKSIDLGGGVTLSGASEDLDFLRGQDKPRPWTAALSLVVEFPKITRTSDPNAPHLANRRADSARVESYERLNVARMCLALAINQRVVEVTRANKVLESVPDAAGYAGASEEYAPHVPSIALDDTALQRAQSLHERLLRLPRALQDRLAVALHRWHACFLHNGITPDLFIDVGIGLECVFLPEESAELKHRLTVRAARLLGDKSVQSRMEVAKVIGVLYDARSRAVHRGCLLEKFKGPRPRDIYDLAFLGDHFLREGILRMIDRGRDDWDELVFA